MIHGAALRELTGPVVGWRVWTVRETQHGLMLGSVLHDFVWPTEEPALAACVHDDAPHPVPGPQCSCGFHAARDPADVRSYLIGRDEPSTIARVLGQVALWGHVLETESGWRASHALPLFVSSSMCAPPFSRTCTATRSRSARRSRTSSSVTSI